MAAASVLALALTPGPMAADPPGEGVEAATVGLAPIWASPELEFTYQIDWGDWDNDGDLDLVIGSDATSLRIYENDGLGTATSLSLVWSWEDYENPLSVAWGDWDNDGTLDLAVGSYDARYVLANDGLGLPTSMSLVWESSEMDVTFALAWVDWDGNGTLDLTAGNYGTPTRVYANDGSGTASSLTLAWSSPFFWDTTVDIAWGDWDGNGTPDLAVANEGQPARVYRNDGLGTASSLTATWSSTTTNARAVAWGDWDGNGTLDLAAAFPGANQVYANDGAGLSTSLTPAWSSLEADDTMDVKWGDLNGDGLLDLVVGNTGPAAPNVRLYVNDGLGTGSSLTRDWSSAETNEGTRRVALADWDNDGDLDLATGNYSQANRVYENQGLTRPWSRTGLAAGPTPRVLEPLDDGGFAIAGESWDMEFWVGRLSAEGVFLWQKELDEPSYWVDQAQTVRELADGSLLATGIVGAATNPLMVVKLDSSGTVLWQRSYPGLNTGVTSSIAALASAGSSLMLTGYSGGWAGLMTLDLDGNVTAHYLYEPAGTNTTPDVIGATSDGGAIIAGIAHPTVPEEGQLLVMKLDGSGLVEWQKTYGDPGPRLVRFVAQTPDGGFLVLALDPWDLTGTVDAGVWLLKLGALGNIVWQKRYTVPGLDSEPDSVVVLPGGGAIVSGSLPWEGYAFAFEVDPSGNIVWQRGYGNPLTGSHLTSLKKATNGYLATGYSDGLWALRLDENGMLDAGCPDFDRGTAFVASDTAAVASDLSSTRHDVLGLFGPPASESFPVLDTNDVLTEECPYPACVDGDGDGYGDPGTFACTGGGARDCDDGDGQTYPSALQACDGVNNDCLDGSWPSVPADEVDDDGDGQAECAGDCDDADPRLFSGNLEVCDGLDNDCNTLIDDGNTCPPFPPTSAWISAETDATFRAAWGDWDNDGDLDLAVGNEAGPARVYGNDGLGTATSLSLVWSSAGIASSFGVAWGDWDGDGDLDLAVGTGSADVVFANDGLGLATSLTAVWSSAEIDVTRDVHWADWDDDGDLDLAAASYGTPTRVYENDGLGTATSLTLAWSSPFSTDHGSRVEWGDWDGDGDPDLAVANEGEPIRVYENDGLGGPGSLVATWASSTLDAGDIAWGDWDGDGDLDLAAAFPGANRVYANDGLGTASSLAPAWSSAEVDDSTSVEWGDLNGDGILDLAVGNVNTTEPNARVYVNDGLGAPTSLTLDWSSPVMDDGTKDVVLGDWDNDGDLDLAAGNSGFSGAGHVNRVYENGGMALREVQRLNQEAYELAWGDVDGDGDLDLAIASYTNVEVFVNDGLGMSGSLTPGWTSPNPGHRSVAWADLDDDADLDLVDSSVRMYTNDGAGGLADSGFYASSYGVYGVAPGDVDGDGELELAWGSVRNEVWGKGRVLWQGGEILNCGRVAWGDWDEDGDLDFAAACGNGLGFGVARVYTNVGYPLYFTTGWSTQVPEWIPDVAWGDWDGDGDLDLAAAGTPGRVYENDGLGLASSLQPVWEDPFGGTTLAVDWADWDGDGDLDLLLGGRIFSNTGEGLPAPFLVAWASPDPNSAVAWGDWDGDGDLDLAAGDEGGSVRIYENPRVQRPAGLVENPLHPVVVERPGGTPAAAGYSSPRWVYSPVPVSYLLFDEESDEARLVKAEYSLDGGGQWFPATPASGGDGLTDLAASPSGTPHLFSWDAAADGAFADNIVFRLTVPSQIPLHASGPIQLGSLSAVTAPFRVQLDSDGDLIRDLLDNCPEGFNPGQGLSGAGDRVWLDANGNGIQDGGESGFGTATVLVYNEDLSFLDFATSAADGSYSVADLCPGEYFVGVILPSGYSPTAMDQGSDDLLDSDVDPATGRSPLRTLVEGETATDLDIGVVSGCTGPDEPVYISAVGLTTDGNGYPILTFQDPNQPAQVTGYNVYRSDDAGVPAASWPMVASDVIDMDEGVPNKQWVDSSGDVSPTGIWYYRVHGYSAACLVEGP